jgi:hypothetical protein
VSYQVNWEIQALDQAAGFLRDDPIGVAALWDTVGQVLAATLSAHRLAAFDVHVLAGRCW